MKKIIFLITVFSCVKAFDPFEMPVTDELNATNLSSACYTANKEIQKVNVILYDLGNCRERKYYIINRENISDSLVKVNFYNKPCESKLELRTTNSAKFVECN